MNKYVFLATGSFLITLSAAAYIAALIRPEFEMKLAPISASCLCFGAALIGLYNIEQMKLEHAKALPCK